MQSASPEPTHQVVDDAWRALDEREEWSTFSRPAAGREGWQESYLAIQGMHCASCALTVERALAELAGIDGVQVNGASATARVTWSPQASRPSEWMAALRRAGYGAIPAGDLIDAASRIREQRLLLWRWLVAGFCMMQVMMYSVPAYVAAAGDMTPDIESLLRWASWVLTLPVVLFSCWPFFGLLCAICVIACWAWTCRSRSASPSRSPRARRRPSTPRGRWDARSGSTP